jgi:hypothetical protein
MASMSKNCSSFNKRSQVDMIKTNEGIRWFFYFFSNTKYQVSLVLLLQASQKIYLKLTKNL